MIHQDLAARIAQKRAEGTGSTSRPATPTSTYCWVLRNRIVNTTEPPLPKKRRMPDVTSDEGDELGDGCGGSSATKRRTVGGGVHRYKPSNAAGVSEPGCSNRHVITATSSTESTSLATVSNARVSIPRWICPGCGKCYGIQSKRSWTNHMIACTGDMPPPIKKRKRRGK
ncbi:hypothetical protein SeLEV6574_g08573 [Synchytrium endobioticum]|uniref:Uncharacterized protein n=1 Tax=Synchytrium endobioticum TaxID=286115 RepID=A0A507BYN5_9FUNG|nr:hypothetical protein SeLEV6574_g08573 [Synchytrium endobioticum]